jgi:hypothetical protein
LIQKYCALTKGEAPHSAGNVLTNAGQLLNLISPFWDASLVVRNEHVCQFNDVICPGRYSKVCHPGSKGELIAER